MTDYPQSLPPVDHVEPVPRRIRATVAGETVLDTTRALYVWEWPKYPRYYIPSDDVRADVLVDEHRDEQTPRALPGSTGFASATSPARARRCG